VELQMLGVKIDPAYLAMRETGLQEPMRRNNHLPTAAIFITAASWAGFAGLEIVGAAFCFAGCVIVSREKREKTDG
jgi:hypothetical protein